MITITRKGLQLAINDEIIPAQGSSDVPVQFINDDETYRNYLIEPRVGWFKGVYPKSTLAKYENGIIYLPAEVFAQNGKVVIVIALIDPQNSNHIEVTQPVILAIANAPLGDIILPEKETWEQAVTSLVKQLNEQIQADVAEAIKKANKASEDATEALNISNQTNQTINEKIEDGSFVPQATAGTVEMTQPGTKAEVTITGDKKNPEFNFRIPKNEIDDSEDIKKALLQGTYTTDLSEEYKGVASDYGAEILKIEGKSEQVTTNGYQLLNPDLFDEDKTNGGITFMKQADGSVRISGSLEGDKLATFNLGNYINLLEDGKKYRFNSESDLGVCFIGYNDGTPNGYSGNFTVDKKRMVEIRPYIQFSEKRPPKKTHYFPMLNEGDEIKPFEVYSGGMPSPNPNYPQEIRNALDEPLVSVGRNLCNDKYGYSYSKIYNYISSKSNIKYAFKKMKPKTKYTMFFYGISFIKKINSFGIKDANSKNPNSTGGSFGGLSKCVFETTDISNPIDNNVLFFSMSVSKLTESEQAELPNMKVMIVEGDYSSDDLPYEEHKYAETNLNFQRMCSLPNGTCDTYENGVSTQKIGLYGFNGHSSEDWKIDKTFTDCTRFYIVKNDIKRRDNYTDSILCNRLKTLTSHTTKEKGISSYTNSDYPNQNWIYVNGFNEFTTVEQFTDWLENNPINIQYELETPITEKVELPIVPTFYHYTNIYQSDDVKAKIQYGLRSKVDECPYDIGDLYITMNEILPSVKWKGTKWERVEGLVPVGYKESDADFGTLGKTGGAKTVTLKEEQIPEHGHQAKAKKAGNHKHGIALKTAAGSATPHTGAGIKEGSWSSTDTHAWLDKGLCEELGEHDHVITVENAGGSQAHNNLQPYKVFNMWLRTK